MKMPKHLQRLSRFAVAFAKHAANGSPKASQADIDKRLAECELCPHFQHQHCQLCGCRCKGNKQFLNKLAWADQICPDGRWGSVESVGDSE